MRRASAAGLAFGFAAGVVTSAQAEVVISSATTKNMNCSSGVCTPTAKNAVLNVDELTGMLASGNVQVNTGSGSLAQHVEDIVVACGFNWTSANSLTLDAYESVTFDRAVSVAGSGGVKLTTNDGGSGGALSFEQKGRLSFLGTSNNLTINGNSYTLANTIESLATDVGANASGFYALSDNYDAKSDGTYAAAPVATTFEGAFNGLGNTISHLTIHAGSKGLKIGLFAEIDTPASVNSIRITDAHIKSLKDSYAGVLVGYNNGTIFNAFAGGSLVANSGTLGSTGGGLVGLNEGTLDETAASTNTQANGKASGSIIYLGGLVGDNDGTIERSYATGTAIASSSIGRAVSGGLAGFSEGDIDNCYASGSASIGASTGAGGLVGYNAQMISNAYSTGAPTAAGGFVGGSIGVDISDGGISNDYWDTSTSGITDPSQGAGSPSNDPGITGETTAQLDAGLPTGFDPTIWAENPNVNGGLPYLIANPPQ